MRTTLVFLGLLSFLTGRAQTLGGNAIYNFLHLPASPMLTAMGGTNVSYRAGEVGLAAFNPSLLGPEVNRQLNLSFNNFLGGIKTYSLTGAGQHTRLNTVFGGHIYFVDYGSVPQTDASGNVSGSFRPVDFLVQASAARSYLEKWHYGASLKLISSNYQQYRSAALAFDVGVHYTDSSHNLYASLLARNMGVQLKTYAGAPEDLPFDMIIGLTKRLDKAPLGFSITAQHLHHFDILYHDTLFNRENGLPSNHRFVGKLLNHFVFAGHVFIGENLEATLGYNRLRRTELNTGLGGNGWNGFSMGLRVRWQKLQVLYARSSYQRNISYNQLGLTLQLDQLSGIWKDL